MPIYRLDPSNPGDPSWRNSVEKDSVWACAPSIRDARDLVAAKSAPPEAKGGPSPWLDETATSCVADPTVSSLGDGDVVRQDGSRVA